MSFNQLQIMFLSLAAAASAASAAEPVTRQLRVERTETIRGGDGRSYQLELLGKPLTPPPTPVKWVTPGPDGDRIAWGATRSPDKNGLIGYGIKSGRRYHQDWSDRFLPHGLSSAGAFGRDSLYILAGNKPSTLFKFHVPTGRQTIIQELDQKKIGVYWLERAVGPDGRIYWGIFPTASVVGVDPATDEFLNYGRMTEESGQAFVLYPQVDDDNILYAPVGLAHPELYALNLKTREKRQILTGALRDRVIARKEKLPLLKFSGGKVYLRVGSAHYLCRFDGIDETPSTLTESPDLRQPPLRFDNGEVPFRFTEQGLEIRSADGSSIRNVPVAYPDLGHAVFALGSVRDGVLYGSGIFPGNVFGLNLDTLQSTDYGVITIGKTQVYDLFDTPQGLLLTSYIHGGIELFDPASPVVAGENPRRLAKLAATAEQERVWGFPGGIIDGKVYSGSLPIKGTLGGALVRVDLRNNSVSYWRDFIPGQSINSHVHQHPARPGVLLFGSWIAGGEGIKRTATLAVLAAWDTVAEKLLWTKTPFKKAGAIEILPAADGKMLVTSGQSYALFDPATESFTPVGELPGPLHPVPRCLTPAGGPQRANYLVNEDALYCYTPSGGLTKLFRHTSLANATALKIHGSDLYYGEHGRLWRLRLPK